jgi:hypothetical protein
MTTQDTIAEELASLEAAIMEGFLGTQPEATQPDNTPIPSSQQPQLGHKERKDKKQKKDKRNNGDDDSAGVSVGVSRAAVAALAPAPAAAAPATLSVPAAAFAVPLVAVAHPAASEAAVAAAAAPPTSSSTGSTATPSPQAAVAAAAAPPASSSTGSTPPQAAVAAVAAPPASSSSGSTATPAPGTVDSAAPITPADAFPAKSYVVAEDVRQKVLTAVDASGVPVAERNKLYAALNRAMKQSGVPPAIVEKWESTKNKFDMLKEWVSNNCSFPMDVVFGEERQAGSETYNDQQFGWFSEMDLMIKFHGWEYPDGAAHVKKLISAAKASKRHPDFPKDKDMKLYKILNAMVTGTRDTVGTNKFITSKIQCEQKSEVEMAMNKVKLEAKRLQGDVSSDGSSDDDDDNGKKRKRKQSSQGKPKAKAKASTDAPTTTGTKGKKKTDGDSIESKIGVCHQKAMQLRKLASTFDVSTHRGKMMFESLTQAAAKLKKLQETYEELVMSGKGGVQEEVQKVDPALTDALKIADEEIAFAGPRAKAASG